MGHNIPARVPSKEVIEREVKVLEMRRAGFSFQAIADELHISHRSDAAKLYKRAMARTLQEPAADIRRLESERLDALQVGVWARAIAGDPRSVDSVVRVMERRAKLLGLDHAHGIAERALELEAAKVRLIAVALGKMFDELGLTEAQRRRGQEILLAELYAHVDEDATGEDPADVVVDGVVVEDTAPPGAPGA
jgi:hypothetical protein